MTILDDPAEDAEVLLDRRRASAGPRRSWASSEPFEAHPRPQLAAFDANHWGSTAGRYARKAFVLDVIVTALVVGSAALLGGPSAWWWAAITGVMFLVAVATGRGYDRRSLGDGPGEFQAVLRAGMASAALVALTGVALAVQVPRFEIAMAVVLLTGGTAIGRHSLRRSLHARRSRGTAMSRTLVVGDATSVHQLIHDLRGATHHGYQVVGVCLPSITDEPPQDGVPTLGAL
ncbi:MAG TPA: sugar transferase, partial [Cellulomonas sp.]|nr:sugar transferase [Cellulomonas sp.]